MLNLVPVMNTLYLVHLVDSDFSFDRLRNSESARSGRFVRCSEPSSPTEYKQRVLQTSRDSFPY